MSRTGRKRHNDEPVKWTLNIPRSVADDVENIFRDPLTGRVTYGARNKLLTRLLRLWLADRTKINNLLDEIPLDELNKQV